MPAYMGRFRVRKKRRKAPFTLMLIFLVFLMLYLLFNIALMPVLKTAAVYRARMVAITTINDAVGKVLKEDDISYDKLMNLEKNSSGQIQAVTANSLQINLLKYDITNEVVNELSKVGKSDMSIPLGNVIGGQLFTGRGPFIKIKFYPVGNVISEITSDFTAAGINQTRQQIMLDVRADITVMMSSYNVSTSVDSNVCIAELTIIGSVPNTYFQGDVGSAGNAYVYGYGASSSSGKSSATSGSSKSSSSSKK